MVGVCGSEEFPCHMSLSMCSHCAGGRGGGDCRVSESGVQRACSQWLTDQHVAPGRTERGREVLPPLRTAAGQLLLKPDPWPVFHPTSLHLTWEHVGRTLYLDVYRVVSHKGQSWRRPQRPSAGEWIRQRSCVCPQQHTVQQRPERDACSPR